MKGLGPRRYRVTVTDAELPRSKLRQVRILIWVLAALAVAGMAVLLLIRSAPLIAPQAETVRSNFGGSFTLLGADGKTFSSSALAGKPYAIFFGFTRCGDVCPTTLSRLVKLRREAANEAALNVVFVTIDPKRDGPNDVGQYASLFGAPIIGLTGSDAQIERVKQQYGIFAQPEPMAGGHDSQMNHTGTVLLFDRNGKFVTTLSRDEPDSAAVEKLKKLSA